MKILHLALHHPKLLSHILRYLTNEDKRKFFFTNNQLQHALSTYPTMTQFSQTLQLQTLTFYFPDVTYGKRGPLHSKHRTSLTIVVNTNATKLTCLACLPPYYNPNHEKQYRKCQQHRDYTSINNMYITIKGRDLRGHLHATKQCFKPIGNNRKLCYCNSCKSFLFYLSGNGVTYITCYNCRRTQERQARSQPIQPHTYKQRQCPICREGAVAQVVRRIWFTKCYFPGLSLMD